jgi:hypothetical protein
MLAVAAAGFVGFFLLNQGPFQKTPVTSALLADFGAPRPPATPVAHDGRMPSIDADPVLVGLPNGHVVETLHVRSAPNLALGFHPADSIRVYPDGTSGSGLRVGCPGALSGDFAGVLPQILLLPPLPGARPLQVMVRAGPATGAPTVVTLLDAPKPGAFTERLEQALPIQAATTPDSTLGLYFKAPWSDVLAKHKQVVRGAICGFTADEAAAFSRKFGTTYANPFPTIDVFVEFSEPTVSAGYHQDAVINVVTANLELKPAKPLTNLSVLAPSLRQDDPQWAGVIAGNRTLGETGTVPTAIATLLAAFGRGADVPAVARALRARNAWTPGAGADWAGIHAYLRDEGFDVHETDLTEATGGEASRALFLVALRDRSDGAPVETLLVISGYDPGRDDFTVIDPRRGLRHVTWDDMAAGDPWVLAVTR